MTSIIHTMRGDNCTTCNETREWLTETRAAMVEVAEGTDFQVGDIIRNGSGKRRWLVTRADADGRLTLSMLADKGERHSPVTIAPGVTFDGLRLGNNHRYVEAGEQGNLARIGKAVNVA